MWRLIGYALLIWFLYNLVFRFIIPIYRASRKMKQQFREMHDRMQDQHATNQATAGRENAHSEPATKKPSGDYIDFEEVK